MQKLLNSFIIICFLLPVGISAQIEKDSTKVLPISRQANDNEFYLQDCAHSHSCCQSGCSCCKETLTLVLDTLELKLGIHARLMGYRQQYLYPSSPRFRINETDQSYQRDTVSDPATLRNYGKNLGFQFSIVNNSDSLIVQEEFQFISSHKGFYYIYMNGLLGIMDSGFNWIHTPKFPEEVPQWFYNEQSEGMLILSQEGKYGILDGSGDIILAFEYDKIRLWGSYAIVTNQGLHLVYDLEKSAFTIGPFPNIERIYDDEADLNYFKVQNESGYYGVFDEKGKKKLKISYTSIDFRNLWLLKKDDLNGVYSRNFSPLIPIAYDSVLLTQTILVKQDSLWGVFDREGNKLSDCELKLAPRQYNGFTLCRDKNGRGAGAVRTHVIGETDFIAPTYLIFSPTFPRRKEGKYYCVVRRDKGYGILEANKNELVVPMEYDEVKTKNYFHGSSRNISHTDIYLRKGNVWALFEEGKDLEFSITNISEEINKNFQYRPGIRTVIDFW